MSDRGRGILTRLARGESGYATLTAVLVLLVLGALVITPILVYMNTGLEAGQTHERRTDELYAADAGVDYALWHIKMGYVPGPGSPLVLDEFTLNDKAVNVSIWEVPGQEGSEYPAYRIVSVATTTDDPLHPTSTTVESYVTLAYSTASLLDAAITVREDGDIKGDVVGDIVCGGDLEIFPNVTVDGNVLCAGTVYVDSGALVTGDVTYGVDLVNQGILDGDAHYSPGIEIPQIENWPQAAYYRQVYGDQVDKDNPFVPNSIDLAGVSTSIGPLYRDGDLDINNSGGSATLTLNGTMYVTGQLNITGKLIDGEPNLMLDLNGQTIFCEYLDPVHPAINISSKCTIKGPGCIIAVGNIFFGPRMVAGGEENYVILMSINGTTDLHPQGDFYGAVLGDVKLDVFPAGGKVTYVAPQPGDDLNFPIFNTAEIFTYNIYNSDIYGITASTSEPE